jgi:pimeloyl-ACP methyl ester carboxylesterase
MADDAAAVIRALGLSKVDVLGFSLGGFQAQDLTRRHPELVRKLMLLGTGPRGGNPESAPGVLEAAPRPVPTLEDFLFLFFGRSEAAKKAGRDFWERRHRRVDQDPPSSPEVIQAQIEANMYYLPKLDRDDPFAHLRSINQPTFILNGVEDVMIPTINSWHMSQNIPNAQLFIYPDAGHGAQFQYPERFLKHASSSSRRNERSIGDATSWFMAKGPASCSSSSSCSGCWREGAQSATIRRPRPMSRART